MDVAAYVAATVNIAREVDGDNQDEDVGDDVCECGDDDDTNDDENDDVAGDGMDDHPVGGDYDEDDDAHGDDERDACGADGDD